MEGGVDPSLWYEIGGFSLLGPDLVYEVLKKVPVKRDTQKMAQSRQKYFSANSKSDLLF